jgi:hypothetical protein
VVQGIDPEFKPQYNNKKKENLFKITSENFPNVMKDMDIQA